MKADAAFDKPVIREITDHSEYTRSVRVIRKSFRTVADDLGLTRENSPEHPAFYTVARLKGLKSRGARFFGLFIGGEQIGFIAVEKAERLDFLSRFMQIDEGVYWLERLAVLPPYRRGGNGAKLVDYAIDFIRQHNGKKVALGMINEQSGLKDWYKKLGFREIRTEKFPNMPFSVCFMERDVSPLENPKY